MSTGRPWPRSRARLRERPRALTALVLAALALVVVGFGIGAALPGDDSGHQADIRHLKRAAAQQSELARTGQSSVVSLRAQNARLSRRVTIQRTRATFWKRRYLSLRRSRAR